MVEPISQGSEDAREHEQKIGSRWRKEFVNWNQATQEAMLQLLEDIDKLVSQPEGVYKIGAAVELFFDRVYPDNPEKSPAVDWDQIQQYIRSCCGRESDMEGFRIVPKTIPEELNILRALYEDQT
jgi:hypothetical protein